MDIIINPAILITLNSKEKSLILNLQQVITNSRKTGVTASGNNEITPSETSLTSRSVSSNSQPETVTFNDLDDVLKFINDLTAEELYILLTCEALKLSFEQSNKDLNNFKMEILKCMINSPKLDSIKWIQQYYFGIESGENILLKIIGNYKDLYFNSVGYSDSVGEIKTDLIAKAAILFIMLGGETLMKKTKDLDYNQFCNKYGVRVIQVKHTPSYMIPYPTSDEMVSIYNKMKELLRIEGDKNEISFAVIFSITLHCIYNKQVGDPQYWEQKTTYDRK